MDRLLPGTRHPRVYTTLLHAMEPALYDVRLPSAARLSPRSDADMEPLGATPPDEPIVHEYARYVSAGWQCTTAQFIRRFRDDPLLYIHMSMTLGRAGMVPNGVSGSHNEVKRIIRRCKYISKLWQQHMATRASEETVDRYGPIGVGVETVLDWLDRIDSTPSPRLCSMEDLPSPRDILRVVINNGNNKGSAK